MGNRFVAYNNGFDTTTDVIGGQSYAGGTAKCAIQLATPSTLEIVILEYGVSFDGSAADTPAVVSLSVAGAASSRAPLLR